MHSDWRWRPSEGKGHLEAKDVSISPTVSVEILIERGRNLFGRLENDVEVGTDDSGI